MVRIKYHLRTYVALGVLVCGVASATAQDKSKKKGSDPNIAARVGDAVITVQQVDAKVLGTNMKLAQSLYDARLKAIEQMVMEQALSQEAASQNLSVDALINRKVAEKVKPVSQEAIQAYYDSHKSRMRGKTLEQTTGQIRNYLASQSQKVARKNLLAQLKKTANVRIMLEPPRVHVAVADNDPFTGARDAKVVIIEFSDFQ